MNLIHRWICGSSRWKSLVETHMAPWTLDGISLGARVLEVGPGAGAATEYLQPRVQQLTCLEIDPAMASQLTRRLAWRPVTVRCGDATSMPFDDATFDAVVCFSMLHHVPSAQLQDRLFRESCRVLRPGGIFVGADVRPGALFNLTHVFTNAVPVDPHHLVGRLLAARLTDAAVDVGKHAFRFRATRPVAAFFRSAHGEKSRGRLTQHAGFHPARDGDLRYLRVTCHRRRGGGLA